LLSGPCRRVPGRHELAALFEQPYAEQSEALAAKYYRRPDKVRFAVEATGRLLGTNVSTIDSTHLLKAALEMAECDACARPAAQAVGKLGGTAFMT
jgi:hypothetical protein